MNLSKPMNLSKLWEIVEDRGAWRAAIQGHRVGQDWATEQQSRVRGLGARKPAPKMLLTVAERHTCINVSNGLAQSQPNW